MYRLEDYRLAGGRRPTSAASTVRLTDEAKRLLQRCRADRIGWVEKRLALGVADASDLAELNRLARQLERLDSSGGLSDADRALAARMLACVPKVQRMTRPQTIAPSTSRAGRRREFAHGMPTAGRLEYRG